MQALFSALQRIYTILATEFGNDGALKWLDHGKNFGFPDLREKS